jgi:hypothetical protein
MMNVGQHGLEVQGRGLRGKADPGRHHWNFSISDGLETRPTAVLGVAVAFW